MLNAHEENEENLFFIALNLYISILFLLEVIFTFIPLNNLIIASLACLRNTGQLFEMVN